MTKTRIEWTDEVWNPVTGCTKVSQGCKHCYAERMFPRPYPGRAFTDVQCHPERLDQPLRWQRPRRVFVNSMSDLFHEAVPDEFLDQVFAVMALAPQHTFQVLTKRPERMLAYCKTLGKHRERDRVSLASAQFDQGGSFSYVLNGAGWALPNVWLGVSVEDQETADERIPLLLQTPAVVRWISAEPLLGPINARLFLPFTTRGRGGPHRENGGLDWIIVGGESGPHARPMHPAWARGLRDQCVAAGVPFLFKQWGEWRPGCDYCSEDDDTRDAVLDTPHKLVTMSSGFWDPEFDGQPPLDTWIMHRTGKKAAGRLLDGELWDQYPE